MFSIKSPKDSDRLSTDKIHAAEVALDDAESKARPNKLEEKLDKLGKLDPLEMAR